jgi:hypothetical protein
MVRPGGYDAEDEISKRSRYRRERGSSTGCGWRRRREHPTDGLVLRLTDEAGKHLAIVQSHIDADAEKADEDGWIEDSVDLSRFAGTTVKVSFLAKTDEEQPTTFYVDDVTLE